MVAFAVKDFGGEIPRREPRLLPDNMASRATNTDLAHGPLNGLPQPEPVIDLSGKATWEVRKAYRVPGPKPGDPEEWLPLPSEFSCVCVSPLANDTLHRVFWTNPPGVPDAGAWWNTYDRIKNGDPHYSLGFIPVDPSDAAAPVVSPIGGGIPALVPNGATVVTPGANYTQNTVLEVPGGVLAFGHLPQRFLLNTTQAVNVGIASAGTGGTDAASALFQGTTGEGAQIEVHLQVVGGALVSVVDVPLPGTYNTNPVNPANEPVRLIDAGPGAVGPTGAAVRFDMGARDLMPIGPDTHYTTTPANPITPTLISGTGSGLTFDVHYDPSGDAPLEDRSYCYTFVDSLGTESSPSAPSIVKSGATDAVWHVANLPASAPPTPSGKNYPPIVTTRLYRTVAGVSGGATFYFVVDLAIGITVYNDTIPNTTVVQNNILASVSFAPPVEDLDGLISIPGGMLVGFTGNTIHFCEPNRPNAWPAGYDQSLHYPIVALALWQQSLVVLTSGFPSTGTGNSPAQYIFAQIQTPEPCISRGSVVTDLAGVYYSSPNGLVALNYYGAQNQTLSNLTREIWIKRFHGDNLVACRHRAQYLAINGTGMGFLIDYTEERLGICSVSPFVDVVSIWNDVYTGDAYIMANEVVYKWDSMDTPPLIYRWRSREFYFASPVSLGACQVSLDPEVLDPAPTDVVPPPDTPMENLTLPPGVNARFRLYAGPSQDLIHEEWLQQTRCIFRFPSGRKAFNWQFEIIARCSIHSVELASTMRELKTV
jgi:hypothetical protein